MSGRKSRLGRKAERAVLSEQERDTEKKLGEARAKRDAALHKATVTYREALAKLEKERGESRKAANDGYEQARAEILKQFAEEQKAA